MASSKNLPEIYSDIRTDISSGIVPLKIPARMCSGTLTRIHPENSAGTLPEHRFLQDLLQIFFHVLF